MFGSSWSWRTNRMKIKSFRSLLILGLIGTGLYFGGVKTIDIFMEMEKLPLNAG